MRFVSVSEVLLYTCSVILEMMLALVMLIVKLKEQFGPLGGGSHVSVADVMFEEEILISVGGSSAPLECNTM